MESLVKFVQDEFVTRKDLPKFSAGDTITYKMYSRSRGGSHNVAYHEVIGGVSQDVWLVVQEVVN